MVPQRATRRVAPEDPTAHRPGSKRLGYFRCRNNYLYYLGAPFYNSSLKGPKTLGPRLIIKAPILVSCKTGHEEGV